MGHKNLDDLTYLYSFMHFINKYFFYEPPDKAC